MKQKAFGTLSVAEEERRLALQDTFTEQLSPAAVRRETACNALSVPQLTAQCLKEIDNYHRGEPNTDIYGVELLRRATVLGDPEAWESMQHCFSGLVLAGCVVILIGKLPVALRTKRTMSLRPLNASGKLPH